jgi:hypothetical protein
VQQYYSRKQATGRIRDRGIPIGDNFLAQAASDGTGPEYQYSGRHPVYREDKLDEWIEARLSAPVRSPAEKRLKQDFDPPLSPPTRTTRQHGRRRKQPASDLTPSPPT